MMFWDDLYRASGGSKSIWGEPSRTCGSILESLPARSGVLDLGCGDGRNAFLFAAAGHDVTCVDISSEAIRRLRDLAERKELSVVARTMDVMALELDEDYDLIMANGVFNSLASAQWEPLVRTMRKHTKPKGFNMVTAFTDRLPAEDTMKDYVPALLPDKRLYSRYRDWRTIVRRSYDLAHSHHDSAVHRHHVNKLVAQKP